MKKDLWKLIMAITGFGVIIVCLIITVLIPVFAIFKAYGLNNYTIFINSILFIKGFNTFSNQLDILYHDINK